MIRDRRSFFSFLLLGAVASGIGGCVERKITLGSDPAGAMATVNGVEIGRTPVTFPFEWYGDYEVVLRAQKNVGTDAKPVIQHYYLHTHQTTKTPPSQIIGIDLFAELLPFDFKDHQFWAFNIPPVEEIPDEVLIQRAKELKGELDQPDALQKQEQDKNKKK